MRKAVRGHPFAVRWAVSAGLLFVIMMMWGIASPVPSGPDEEAQLVKAAAVAHGTLIGTLVPGRKSKGTVTVKVPATIQSARRRASCDYNIYKSGACIGQVIGSSRMVSITTYEGRYPPLYYLLTGLPTLFTSAPSVLHLMRAVSALIVALLLGMAFAAVSTWGRSSLLLIALAVTVTPTVLYLGGVVNPSAMEVAGGILLWAALTVLVMQRSDDPPPTLIAAAVVGSVALCASRPLSTVFFALILASFVAIRPRACRALLAWRRVKVGLAVSLVIAFVSALYVIYAKSYEVEAFGLGKQSTSGYLAAVAGRGGRALRQVIGAFGSPNFSVPEPVLAVWLITAVGLIAVALILARRRDALVLLGLFALLGFILPFIIVYSHVKTDGVVWQGRYSLPLIAGIPILSGVLVGDRYPNAVAAVRRRIALAVLPVLCFGWIGAFYWFLRRYTVSLSGNATNAFHHGLNYWPPVIPATEVFAILVVATLAFVIWIFWEMAAADRRGLDGARQATAPRSSSQPMTESTNPAQPL
jgi:hypothetical protein